MASRGSDRSGDVLAQPTRARLFAHLAALARAAGTDELAAELGLHPSGVRVHLQQMHAAGLLAREQVSQPLGRPRDSWSIAPDALPAGEPPGAYRQLACWLAAGIAARAGRLREIERAGREVGRALSPGGSVAPVKDSLGRTLTALGFAPQREPRGRDRTLFRLGNCPYREAVHANQPVVCALHRGLTLGLLDALAPTARLVNFVPKDPDRAGCLIEVAGFGEK